MRLIRVENQEHLLKLAEKKRTYRLLLNFGAFTKYTISPDGENFKIKMHITDTTESVTKEQMLDEKMFNIKTGIEKGSLYLEQK